MKTSERISILAATAVKRPIDSFRFLPMKGFYVLQPKGSVDTLAMVHNCESMLFPQELLDRGFISRPGKLADSFIWFHNGLRDTHEPRLTFYQTWERIWRLKAEMSIPKLLFGNNVQLPTPGEINEAIA